MDNNRSQRLLRVIFAAFIVFVAWSIISLIIHPFNITSFWGFGLACIVNILLVWIIAGRTYGYGKATLVILTILSVATGALILNAYKGWPFGLSFYHDSLGWKFYRIAWPLPVFWTFFIANAILLTHPKKISNDPKAIFSWSFDAALLLMFLSIIIEPLAGKTSAITWTQIGPVLGIPFSAFLGWFVAAFICSFIAILASGIWQKQKNSQASYAALSLTIFCVLFATISVKTNTTLLVILSLIYTVIFYFWYRKLKRLQNMEQITTTTVTQTTVEVIERYEN